MSRPPQAATDLVEPDLDGDGDVTADDVPDEPVTGGGPVAVVTGASRGIGKHLARALEDAGWVVERGSTQVAPVTDATALESWVNDIIERHGAIDLLVNNAGVIDTEVDVLASDPAQWWHTIEVNLLGPYLLTRLVGRQMAARGTGRIVNINSGSAYKGAEVASAYSASKAALHQLTAATAGSGIPCLDLMPGVVHTDMTASMEAHRERTEWTAPASVAEILLAFANGELDPWSGRMVRAGVDTVTSLRDRQTRAMLDEHDRTLVLHPWGPDDPLA